MFYVVFTWYILIYLDMTWFFLINSAWPRETTTTTSSEMWFWHWFSPFVRLFRSQARSIAIHSDMAGDPVETSPTPYMIGREDTGSSESSLGLNGARIHLTQRGISVKSDGKNGIEWHCIALNCWWFWDMKLMKLMNLMRLKLIVLHSAIERTVSQLIAFRLVRWNDDDKKAAKIVKHAMALWIWGFPKSWRSTPIHHPNF